MSSDFHHYKMSALKASKKDGNTSSLTAGSTKTKIASLTASNLRANGGAGNGHEGQEDGTLRVKVQMLEGDLMRRQTDYVSKERAYKARVEDLEEELNAQKTSKTGWMNVDSKVQKLKAAHAKILDNVELVQDRTSRILQDQERDLLRAFRAR